MNHGIREYIDRSEVAVREGASRAVRWTKEHPWIVGGVVAVAVVGFWGLVFYNRKRIISAGKTVVDAAKKQFFFTVIPARSRVYGDIVLRVAQEEGVSPFMLVAILERESRSGDALTPKGPAGTGDAGHGRGLMQIDDRSFGPDENGVGKGDGWLSKNNWRDPYVNIKKGAQVYKGKRAYIRSKLPNLSESELIAASIAAYNTGEGRVVESIKKNRDVDSTTANGNYSSDVLQRIAAMEAAFNKLTGGV